MDTCTGDPVTMHNSLGVLMHLYLGNTVKRSTSAGQPEHPPSSVRVTTNRTHAR